MAVQGRKLVHVLARICAVALVASCLGGAVASATPRAPRASGGARDASAVPGDQSLSMPAAPVTSLLIQPDGSSFRARAWGNQARNGYATPAGYTIGRDANGVWRYASAITPDGTLTLSDARAEGPAPADVSPGLRPSTPPAGAISASRPAVVHTPNVGNAAELVILTQFADQNSVGTTPADWSTKFFGGAGSVTDYYDTVSYGHFHLVPAAESSGTANDGVVGWVTVADNHPVQTDSAALQVVASHAFAAADPFVNYASFDTNNDGVIAPSELHITIIAAGYEASYGPLASNCGKNVWGHQTDDTAPPSLDGKTIGSLGYTMFGENHCTAGEEPGHIASIGIMAHELGHDLGFPDLYDIDLSSDGVGTWSIMSYGSWNTAGGVSGSSPAELDPFDRIYQTWVTPTQVSGAAVPVALASAESGPNVVQVLNNPNGVDWNFQSQSGTGEYFLVENRQQTSYDASLSGCGVLIWHIDETRTSTNSANADETRRLVTVEEADGLSQLETTTLAKGDSGDPYPGSTNNLLFGNATTPNSHLYSGANSNVTVAMSGPGCAATKNITISTTAALVPGPPTIGTAVAGNTVATLSWTAPASDGGSAITGYRVTPYIGGAAQAPQVFNSTATSQTVTGLTNLTPYTFKVAAINAIGTGPDSANSNVVTPAFPPDAPTITGVVAGDTLVTLSWVPGFDGGSPITGYRVTPYIAGVAQTIQSFASTNTTQDITGLTNKTTYTFRVAAVNAIGTGPNSAESTGVTPRPPTPDAPTNVLAVAGDRSATVSWTPPADSGKSEIVRYGITPYVDGLALITQQFDAHKTTRLVTGLTNGTTYTFKVEAVNSYGQGEESAPSNPVTPFAVPVPIAFGSATDSFVRAAYADFLGRPPSAAELSEKSAALDAHRLTRRALVDELASSSEWVSRIVDGFYTNTLGRPGDVGGRAFWVGQIQGHTMTVSQVAARFYASPEYFRGIGGNSNASWVKDLSVKLLGRTASATDVTYWTGQAGSAGRSSVASRLYGSNESLHARVAALYLVLLGRGPDTVGQDYWAKQIATKGDIVLASELAASTEYYVRASGRFP